MDLRFPIGPFKLEGNPTKDQIERAIDDIAEAPAKLRNAVEGLSAEQLETPYRPEGWTVRQVVHHVPDSHMNAYIRFKMALTEDEPTIKPYDEAGCAALDDSRLAPVDASLNLLESLHERWVTLLRLISPRDWTRSFRHPERGRVTLNMNLALYAWHGRHHIAHITSLRNRLGWD